MKSSNVSTETKKALLAVASKGENGYNELFDELKKVFDEKSK